MLPQMSSAVTRQRQYASASDRIVDESEELGIRQSDLSLLRTKLRSSEALELYAQQVGPEVLEATAPHQLNVGPGCLRPKEDARGWRVAELRERDS